MYRTATSWFPWHLFTFFQIHFFYSQHALSTLTPPPHISSSPEKKSRPTDTQTLATALRSEGGNKVRVISWRPPFLSLPPSRATADLSPPRPREPATPTPNPAAVTDEDCAGDRCHSGHWLAHCVEARPGGKPPRCVARQDGGVRRGGHGEDTVGERGEEGKLQSRDGRPL